jgi:hypothetical protein
VNKKNRKSSICLMTLMAVFAPQSCFSVDIDITQQSKYRKSVKNLNLGSVALAPPKKTLVAMPFAKNVVKLGSSVLFSGIAGYVFSQMTASSLNANTDKLCGIMGDLDQRLSNLASKEDDQHTAMISMLDRQLSKSSESLETIAGLPVELIKSVFSFSCAMIAFIFVKDAIKEMSWGEID